jgi:transposase-like protein
MPRPADCAKEQFWRRMRELHRRSGLTVRAFCARHGLAQASFYAWRRAIAQRDQQTAPASHPANSPTAAAKSNADPQPLFLPLRVLPATARPTLELVLGHDRVVRVPADFDAATLRQLLAVLEETPTC